MKQQRPTEGVTPGGDASTAAAGTAEAEAGERDRQENKSKDDRRNGEEVGGPKGPEPTRFGDWERKGRCIDF
jgi:hypothetical protein